MNRIEIEPKNENNKNIPQRLKAFWPTEESHPIKNILRRLGFGGVTLVKQSPKSGGKFGQIQAVA